MDSSRLDKLGDEVDRYQNKDFLKAIMAVSALAAAADDVIDPVEIACIWNVFNTEPALQSIDAEKARDILEGYLEAIAQDGRQARQVLYQKVNRMAGDDKKARTLLRTAYLVIASDRMLDARERREFRRLCRVLDFEPGQIWAELAEDSGTSV